MSSSSMAVLSQTSELGIELNYSTEAQATRLGRRCCGLRRQKRGVIEEKQIVVGLSLSLTGSFARQGQQALNGIRLWQSYVNTAGGLDLGGQAPAVRLLYYDDQSRASLAQQNVLRLQRDDRVNVLFGPYSSGLTLAVAPIAEQHGKILWNHGGSSDEIWYCGHRWLVSVPSPASDYLRELPRWLAAHAPHLRRICVLHSLHGTFVSHVARGLTEAVQALGRHSSEVVPLDFRKLGEDAIPRKLRSLRPEVAVVAGRFEEEVRLLRTRHRWPGTIELTAAVAAGVHAFYEELGDAAEGVIGPSQWEPEGHPGPIIGPDSEWFVRNFQKRFRKLPEYTAAASFAVGLVFAECARRASSLDDEGLRAAATELDLNTFYGRFRLDSTTGRQIGHRVLLIQWRQGRRVILRL
jgi:branched-chain amino acid transport system substrate-binding protein